MLHLYCTHNEQFNQRSYDNLINKFNITIHTMECPRCHAKGSLIFYGHRVRKFIFVTRTVLINAQRCRCKECGAIHIILPSFVVPGFNHVYLSIRKVLNKEPDRSLEDSYFYRFIKSFFPPDVRIKTSYDMHYLFTSGNIYEKIIPSVTAGRPFGYGLI